MLCNPSNLWKMSFLGFQKKMLVKRKITYWLDLHWGWLSEDNRNACFRINKCLTEKCRFLFIVVLKFDGNIFTSWLRDISTNIRKTSLHDIIRKRSKKGRIDSFKHPYTFQLASNSFRVRHHTGRTGCNAIGLWSRFSIIAGCGCSRSCCCCCRRLKVLKEKRNYIVWFWHVYTVNSVNSGHFKRRTL